MAGAVEVRVRATRFEPGYGTEPGIVRNGKLISVEEVEQRRLVALFGDDDVAERADVVSEVVEDLLIDGFGVVLIVERQEQTLRLVRFEGSGVFADVANLTGCQKLLGAGNHIGGR